MTAPVAHPVVLKPEPSPTRPGYTTTEFWTSTVVPTVFLILAQFNILPDTNNPRLGGWIHLGSYLLAAAGYAFYAISRGHMKKGAAIALAVRDVLGSNLADILQTFKDVAPKQAQEIQQLAQPIMSAIQSVDPEFSESQLEDLASIIQGMLTHPQTKAQYEQMITEAVNAAMKNALGNANSPDAVLRVAQTVQAVEDVVAGAQATTYSSPPTTPIDATPRDGAEYTAPQFS